MVEICQHQDGIHVKTFTKDELCVLNTCIRILRKEDSPFITIVESRVADLEQLAAIVDRAPSPTIDLFHESSERSITTLAEKLCSQGLDHIINLPSKAVLGHGFTVAKLHVFGLLAKLSRSENSLISLREDIDKEYNDLLFTLMAEDLYTSLVSKQDSHSPWVQEAAHELIRMWDHRTSGYLETFALAIRELWHVRHAIVPVLGTLLGTMEIMRLNAMLPPVWLDFMSSASDSDAMVYALEEFIFDLRFEELTLLRERMLAEHITIIDRNAAWLLLGKHEANAVEVNPALALYKSFMDRQQMAKKRVIRGDVGPKRSLEEYFVIYLISSDHHSPKTIVYNN
jgi:hypothetical protein